jgi:putative methionine-R-sulfoxide reductase with GAF domain
VLAGDVRLEPDYEVTAVSGETRSELDVPIRVDGAVWGALSVQARAVEAFDDEDVRVMSAVADLVGFALRLGEAAPPPGRLPASP